MTDSSSDKHLTYFKVENFKCFNSLELDDIGLINVIAGDNNIGKSSLLEALLFDEDINIFNLDLGSILHEKGFSYKDRGIGNTIAHENNIKHFLNTFSSKKEFQISFKNQGFKNALLSQKITYYSGHLPDKILHNSKIKKLNTIDNNIITSETNFTSQPSNNEILAPAYLSDQILYEDLVDFYENTLQTDFNLKVQFVEYLKEFVPGAINIEIRTAKDEFKEAHLIIYTQDSSYPIPLNQYGQGTVKMLKLFMAIISFRGNRLMLDEVDNGIHFSRLKDYFKRMILLAKENNTQLFITTHSKECLNAIKDAFESAELKEYQNLFRNYSLNKIKSGEIKAYKYNYEEFVSTLNSDADIRGGL